MKFASKILVLIPFLLNVFITDAQIKSIGVPNIVNHNRGKYKASTQNWSIAQSSKGFMYFGNNDGILEFDGTSWKTYTVPNSSVVRSLLAVGDTIYSGAFEEVGFLAHNATGDYIYHTLNHLIPQGYSNFDEIWNIYKTDEGVVFQSFNYVFILVKGIIKVIEPLSKFSMLHYANNQFFIVDIDNGLMRIQDDTLHVISQDPIFFRNEIRCLIDLDNENILVGTSNEGLYLLNKSNYSIRPWDSEINTRIKKNNLFSAKKLSDGNLAMGSVSNGVYISNRKGQILQHLNRFKGLQNNTILSLFQDRKNNLWLGLDNGIDYLEISSPLTYLNFNFNIESAYASIVHNNIMYVGTNQGLFATDISKINRLNSEGDGYQLIKGTEGQVWSLEVIDNTLFCGHNYGCFVVNGYNAKQISEIRGFWSFLQPTNLNDVIIAGTYTGLVRIRKHRNKWVFDSEIKGFNESSRSMFMDKDCTLWVSHGYRGLFKVELNSTLDSVVAISLFKAELGLPDELPYNIHVINSEMYISTISGIYKYSKSNNNFIIADEINRFFESKGFIDKIHQDNNGNLWYFTNTYLGLLRLLEDATYIDITSPFSSINQILLPAFQNIYVHSSLSVFIGSQNGLVHYTPNIIKDYLAADEVFIKEAFFYGKNREELTFYTDGNLNIQDKARLLDYSQNSVSFKFTAPAYENPEKINFSFRLVGFDSDWSEWDEVNFKEYTNLREGNYTFQIKAINSFNAVSEVKSFHFTIKQPFLRSRIAYILYSIILVLIVIGNFYLIRKRVLKTRLREKLKHEKRLAQREKMFKEQSALSEKEIMQLRNESLKSEMKFKNKELANTTLHLIQKNKTLTYLKEDLSKLLKNLKSDNPEKERVNSLLKKINKDLRNDKGWELFNSYFDEVHQDFINRLKEEYDDLTPKELRLCAYLRMNISTKEIAPLMNISIRGVEISRYRLRKKLNLDNKTNLTDFIISF